MYVQLLMLGGILLGVLIFKGKNEESFGELDRSEHPLKVMYPFALVLYRLVKKKGKEDVFGRREVLREVFINESPELSQRIQGCKCIASILAVIAITCFISFAYEYANEPALVDSHHRVVVVVRQVLHQVRLDPHLYNARGFFAFADLTKITFAHSQSLALNSFFIKCDIKTKEEDSLPFVAHYKIFVEK